jgi:hypothetical protein
LVFCKNLAIISFLLNNNRTCQIHSTEGGLLQGPCDSIFPRLGER